MAQWIEASAIVLNPIFDSALALYKDEKTIDRDKCFKEFDNFLKQQNELIKEIKDTTKNFGLVNFT